MLQELRSREFMEWGTGCGDNFVLRWFYNKENVPREFSWPVEDNTAKMSLHSKIYKALSLGETVSESREKPKNILDSVSKDLTEQQGWLEC